MSSKLLAFLVLLFFQPIAAYAAEIVPLRLDMTCQLHEVPRQGTIKGTVTECVKGAPIVEQLRLENEIVASFLFSLNGETTEAHVAKALRGFASEVNGEYIYPCTAIAVKSMAWIIPGRTGVERKPAKVFIRFLDGKVSDAEWQPARLLQFSRHFTELKGGCPPTDPIPSSRETTSTAR